MSSCADEKVSAWIWTQTVDFILAPIRTTLPTDQRLTLITENYNKDETVFPCSDLIKHISFCWIYFEGRFFFKLTSKTHYIFTKFIPFWHKVTNMVCPVWIELTTYNQSEESSDPNCTSRRYFDAVLLPAQIFLSPDKNLIVKEWVWRSPTRTNCVCKQNKISTRLRWWMFAKTLASSIFFLF